MINRRQFAGAAAAAGASVMWSYARAQDAYPNRPVRLIIPYAAGGGADAAARVLGQGLSREFGQPFIIESRTGANTTVAAVALANAQPDGYTLMMTGSATVSLNPLVMEKLPYDPNTDFAPIGQVSTSPFFLIVSSELGVNSLEELLKKSREMPGQIAYVSNGTGGAIHLGMELLAQRAGVRWNHVPYRGFAPAMPDLLAGRTPIGMMDLAPIGGHAKSGKIKILAVTTGTRSKALPEVPTVAELGFPDFSVESWFALYAPAKTPPALVVTLNEKLRKWTISSEARDALAAYGMTPEGSTPAFVRERYTREQRTFGPLVKAANIKAE